MKTGLLWMQTALTAIGGFLGWYLGGSDSFLYALVVFVSVDYFTGLMCAVQDKKLSSKIGSHGIFKKVMLFLLVGIANMVDTQVIGHDSVLRTAVIFFYLSNEGISILENAAHLGLPVPTRLKGILSGMRTEKEEEKDKTLEEGRYTDMDENANETENAVLPENVLEAVVGTVKESVRFAVRETLMETAMEIGVDLANGPDFIGIANVDLPPVVDADPAADLSGEGIEI